MTKEKDNILFYNSIAEDYNKLDSKESSNRIIREKVKDFFLASVRGKIVLDFGGGTGLDMEWLSENYLQIYFCEPSEKMREQSIWLNREKMKRNSIVFLSNEQSDFHKWSESNPFHQKVDGILANFGVLNNIKDIDHLFQILASILRSEGILVANILNPKSFKLYKKYFLKTIFSMLMRKTITLNLKQGNPSSRHQHIYLHSISSLKKAALPYFEMTTVEDLNGFGFLYVEFRRI